MSTAAVIELDLEGVILGWVTAEGCAAGPSPPALLEEVLRAAQSAVADRESPRSVALKAAVRGLLRFGTYKPTGRGKPASEYLLNAAADAAFPFVNTPVDINNLVSVASLLPISLTDLDRAGTSRFRCRRGREGESYVFNASGQVLDLHDLILLSRLPGDEPCATPVKDSQATKTHAGSTRLLGVVYAPSSLAREAGEAAERMGDLLARHAGAAVSWGLLPPAGKG